MTQFKFAGVFKFYFQHNGEETFCTTIDQARAEHWAGTRDGRLVRLYEIDDVKPKALEVTKEYSNENSN
jgi:hypothetical protein